MKKNRLKNEVKKGIYEKVKRKIINFKLCSNENWRFLLT